MSSRALSRSVITAVLGVKTDAARADLSLPSRNDESGSLAASAEPVSLQPPDPEVPTKGVIRPAMTTFAGRRFAAAWLALVWRYQLWRSSDKRAPLPWFGRDVHLNWAAGSAMGAALLSLAVTSNADAHDSPMAWSYPYECCHDKDCREVWKAAIGERPEGYVVEQTGEVIPYADDRVRNSPDGRYHLCVVTYEMGRYTSCLFVPPRSF